MKKTKGNGFIKTAIASVLAVGLFSAGYIGINHAVFAASTNKAERIPSAMTAVSTPAAEIAPPEDYETPELTVYVRDNEWSTATPGANALLPEEAAQIGALYIWDMFGESIDGKTVEMQYCVWPSHTRAYWHGTVADSRENLSTATAEDMAQYDALFYFNICAISGERIDIFSNASSPGPSDAAKEALIELANSGREGDRERFSELRTLTADLSPEEIEEYTQAAKEFAQRHFVGTEVVSVVFERAGAVGLDLDDEGNFVVTAYSLTLTAADETGREAEVCMVVEHGSREPMFFYISTQNSDIVPGYNADVPGSKG